MTMARKALAFARAVGAGALILAVVAAFAAYRGPDLMLALFAAWKICW